MIDHEKLKDLRNKAGLKQFELAVRANIAQNTLSAIESGKKIPSLETTIAIARALGLSGVDDILELPMLPPRHMSKRGRMRRRIAPVSAA